MNGWWDMLPAAPGAVWDWAGLRSVRPFGALMDAMARTPQNPAWHGEGDVWTHTRMVCETLTVLPAWEALPEENRRILALAALLHDIGKVRSTRMEEGVPVSPQHGLIGAQMARELLWRELDLAGTAERQALREAVCWLIRYHTAALYLFEREEPERRARVLSLIGTRAPGFTLGNLCLLSEADVLGRVTDQQRERLEQVELSREQAREAGCLEGPYPFPSPATVRAYAAGRRVAPDQELYDASWGEVILLCGLPGTGKDSWLAREHPGLPQVCLDELRGRMGVDARDNQGRVVQAAKEQARGFLRAHEPFAWNATCVSPRTRTELVSLFENYGARVRIVWLETGWEENLRRNRERPASVPESAVGIMLSRLEPPLPGDAWQVDWRIV